MLLSLSEAEGAVDNIKNIGWEQRGGTWYVDEAAYFSESSKKQASNPLI